MFKLWLTICHQKGLTRHMKEVHDDVEIKSICSSCGNIVSRRKKLKVHEEKCHNGTFGYRILNIWFDCSEIWSKINLIKTSLI